MGELYEINKYALEKAGIQTTVVPTNAGMFVRLKTCRVPLCKPCKLVYIEIFSINLFV